MNGARWPASVLLFLASTGCASSSDPEYREEIQTLRQEVRDLKRRLDDLDGTSRGAALLVRFPPPRWSVERKTEISQRMVLKGEFPSAEESEFIDNFDAWASALERRRKSSLQENPR